MEDAVAAALERAVARVGDRWSLLLVHVLLDGPKRFSDLQESCGIAPNILSRRLDHLRSATVVVARPYCERPLRHQYALTDEGRQLASALRLLAAWGDRCAPRSHVHHARCGAAAEVRWYCPTCEQVLSDGP
ncbi:MAG: winged helix-turn-helix transcriptional regulator [Egibacteraceae bacterium]